MKSIFAVLLTVFLVSCASIEPKQFIGPDGNTAYAMRCSGMGRTLEACYQKSGELCPNGYKIVSLVSSTVAVPSGDSIIAAPRHDLAIECKIAQP